MPEENKPIFLTIPQVAKLSGYSVKTVERAIKYGFLKAVCPCKQRRVKSDDLKKWLNRGANF
jgi:excisionase family DNA binding protein